jgi:hypothetical protein
MSTSAREELAPKIAISFNFQPSILDEGESEPRQLGNLFVVDSREDSRHCVHRAPYEIASLASTLRGVVVAQYEDALSSSCEMRTIVPARIAPGGTPGEEFAR